jgi:FkbM family methyltransferase
VRAEAVVIVAHGLHWPDGTAPRQQTHALRHVENVDLAVAHVPSDRRRVAVQAGGNVGLWPRRLAMAFQRVLTFEPDAVSRECLTANVAAFPNVDVSASALGAEYGVCHIAHRSLGSHTIAPGTDVKVIHLDSLDLRDVDFLQLDVEGYEWQALVGAVSTIQRCRPVIQVELRNFATKYGKSDSEIVSLLWSWGYLCDARLSGSDSVWVHKS